MLKTKLIVSASDIMPGDIVLNDIGYVQGLRYNTFVLGIEPVTMHPNLNSVFKVHVIQDNGTIYTYRWTSHYKLEVLRLSQ